MKKITRLFIVLLLFLGLFSISRAQVQASEGNVSEARILELINEQRVNNKLLAYKLNNKLVNSANAKGSDMISKGYWSHFSPSGQSPWTLIRNAGYSYKFAGENLAKDYSSSENVVTGWINSPAHKANLLSTKYKEIGISVKKGNIQGKETILVVAQFGSR